MAVDPFPKSRAPGPRVMALGLVGLIVAAGAAAAMRWRLDEPEAVMLAGTEWRLDPGEFAGAESCRPCHAAIVTDQLASDHALTCRDLAKAPPRAPFGPDQAVVDPYTGVRYTMEKGERGPEIAVTRGEVRAGLPLAFEFGSGSLAHGYLVRLDGTTWLDTRLNFYASIHGWDFTSGQENPQSYLKTQPLGKPVHGASAARCFACHSTVLRANNVGKPPRDGSQLRLRPDRSVLGVTCEACHGPSAGHARDHGAGKPVQPRPARSAVELNALCGRCHGSENVNPEHPVIARFQPWGLSQSRCFQASAGRLSCMTCHDPHTNARRDAAFYEAKCLSCHRSAPPAAEPAVGRACPVNPRSGCASCHMPADSKSMRHVTLTDHRIRIVPREGNRQESSARRADAVSAGQR